MDRLMEAMDRFLSLLSGGDFRDFSMHLVRLRHCFLFFAAGRRNLAQIPGVCMCVPQNPDHASGVCCWMEKL